jgi:hypothetical protein
MWGMGYVPSRILGEVRHVDSPVRSGLTKTGLTGHETGPTGPSGSFGSRPKTKKERPSFEELVAKYKKGAIEKWKSRPSKVRSTKSSPKPQERPDFLPTSW